MDQNEAQIYKERRAKKNVMVEIQVIATNRLKAGFKREWGKDPDKCTVNDSQWLSAIPQTHDSGGRQIILKVVRRNVTDKKDFVLRKLCQMICIPDKAIGDRRYLTDIICKNCCWGRSICINPLR